MDQVGELVLSRNQILQFTGNEDDRAMTAISQRLDLITTELQESVMKTRMQPISTIWNKFPRVVRDLAMECGKKIDLKMEGQDTELDKTLIESIKDPLTHLVRNAVDHGVEMPEDRRKAGKSEVGALFLRAFHQGGLVNIEIADDGGGIDPQRITQKAIERNLITEQEANRMNQREILSLIFAAGFSTAEKVTNISGRGVGMDVVKNNIEKINGNIDIQSEMSRGTTIKIRIPLTLAIIPALMVTCAGEQYAIPQVSLVELVHLEADNAKKQIEIIHGASVYRLRGNLLPLVYLSRELMLEEATSKVPSGDENHAVNIVVLDADQRQFGLVVEAVHDTEEIVVKPLGKQLKELSVFAGAMIMGDGRVALILDVLGLAQRARVVSERRDSPALEASTRDQGRVGEALSLLIFENTKGERMALPLSQVARLEKFKRDLVERTRSRDVVQYRGQIMPLVYISEGVSMGGQWALPSDGNDSNNGKDELSVVVHTSGEQSIGLVVDAILDIVEEELDTHNFKNRDGVIGTIVVQGRVTELLDVDKIISTVASTLF